MTIAWVQSQGTAASGNTSSLTATITNPSTAGNLIVAVVVTGGTSGTLSLPDANWATALTETRNTNQTLTIAYLKNCAGGVSSYNFSNSVSNGFAVALAEFSGIDTLSPLDQTASNFTATANKAFDSGTTATTSQADELWIAGFACGNGTQ